MENSNNHQRFFRELLSDSGRQMPFSDFEDDLIAEIRHEYEKKYSVRKNIKLSWLFFILGMLSGIAIVVVLSFYSGNQSLAFLSDNLLPVVIIFICLTIILFAEKLVKISFRRDTQL